MPPPLSSSTRRAVLRLLFEGYSYGKAAAKLGVSKSAVGELWQQFAQGSTPGFDSLPEHAETLRATAIELQADGVSVKDSILGLQAMRTFAQLEIDPAGLQEYARLGERLAQDGEAAPELVRAALEMQRLEDSTGLDYQTLAERVTQLTERHQTLQAEVADLVVHQKDLVELVKERKELQQEVVSFLQQRDSLQRDIAQREQREAELSKRGRDLEGRAHAADERLAAARKATEDLATMGLSLEDLPGLAQRLGAIAQRREISPGDLRQRLLKELEKLDEGLALEALITTQNEAQETVARLQAQEQRLEMTLVVLREKAIEQVEKAGDEAAESVRQGTQRLQGTLDGVVDQVHGLLGQTMRLAGAVAEVGANMRSHDWMKHLLALMEGKAQDLKPQEVRGLAIMVFVPFLEYLNTDPEPSLSSPHYHLRNVIQAFEGWKV